MEEELHDRCNVVYHTCAVTDNGDFAALHHRQSLPKDPTTLDKAASDFAVIYQNVRTLVDKDIGGFNEGELCLCILPSSDAHCTDLEQYS